MIAIEFINPNANDHGYRQRDPNGQHRWRIKTENRCNDQSENSQYNRQSKKENEQQIDDKIKLESSILYEGEEGRVVIPHTKDAAIFWGKQTRWCVSAEGSANYFSHYNDKAPVFSGAFLFEQFEHWFGGS